MSQDVKSFLRILARLWKGYVRKSYRKFMPPPAEAKLLMDGGDCKTSTADKQDKKKGPKGGDTRTGSC